MTTQFKTPTADLQHQYDLLQKEFEYEKEMYRQQIERTGIHRRIQQGLCWYPVVPGKSYYNSLNQLVVEIERLEDKETEHNFEYGRPVCFFTTNGSGNPEYLNFSTVISYVQDDRMVVVLPSPNALTGRPVRQNARRPAHIFSYALSLAEPVAGRGGQPCIGGKGCVNRARSSRNWQNDHFG